MGSSPAGGAPPKSAVPCEAEAGETNSQQGPGGKLWNWRRGRTSGDHDFRVAIRGEERAGALENSVLKKGGVDEDEHIEVLEIPFGDAFTMIESGAIADAKTIALLYYAKAKGLTG